MQNLPFTAGDAINCGAFAIIQTAQIAERNARTVGDLLTAARLTVLASDIGRLRHLAIDGFTGRAAEAADCIAANLVAVASHDLPLHSILDLSRSRGWNADFRAWLAMAPSPVDAGGPKSAQQAVLCVIGLAMAGFLTGATSWMAGDFASRHAVIDPLAALLRDCLVRWNSEPGAIDPPCELQRLHDVLVPFGGFGLYPTPLFARAFASSKTARGKLCCRIDGTATVDPRYCLTDRRDRQGRENAGAR
jgi:hypothetical protein